MRRKDRELTAEQAWEVVDRCADGVVSMLDETGAPYAVPVNIVREENRVYFHSAMAGKRRTACGRIPGCALSAWKAARRSISRG